MKRIYVTTIPLQGRLDLAKNTYRSSADRLPELRT